MKQDTQQLFDINKFPNEPGLLLFGISMSRITTAQNAEACFASVEHLVEKVTKPQVGLNFIYSDYLYFNSDTPAFELKNNYLAQMLIHKNHFKKILSKNKWYVEKSFSFTTWAQNILGVKEWSTYLGDIKKWYASDEKFRECVKKDADDAQMPLTEHQINFFIEEILFFYLSANGKVQFDNNFVDGREKWILGCYPGKPLRSEIYLFQNNPFKLSNPKNKYEHSYYDLAEKKLYHYHDINLDTYET